MTITRSRRLGDHAEVVGDQDHRRAELALQLDDQLEDLRLDGDVERRGRLVGDQHLGIAGERHGDHGALAHAARELVRVFLGALLRLGDADQVAASRWRACSAAFVSTCRWCRISASPICRPMVMTGLSEVIGSWKIIEISLPRTRAHLRLVELQQVDAVEADRAADDAAGRIGDQAHEATAR